MLKWISFSLEYLHFLNSAEKKAVFDLLPLNEFASGEIRCSVAKIDLLISIRFSSVPFAIMVKICFSRISVANGKRKIEVSFEKILYTMDLINIFIETYSKDEAK